MGQKSDTQLLIEGLKNAELFKFLFDRMPKGEGSGLDADLVDGFHAKDLIRKCQEILVETNKVIHGISSPVLGPHKAWHIVGGQDAFDGSTDHLSFQLEKFAVLPAAQEGRLVFNTADNHPYIGV
jgi:hypothetical protein